MVAQELGNLVLVLPKSVLMEVKVAPAVLKTQETLEALETLGELEELQADPVFLWENHLDDWGNLEIHLAQDWEL